MLELSGLLVVSSLSNFGWAIRSVCTISSMLWLIPIETWTSCGMFGGPGVDRFTLNMLFSFYLAKVILS